MSDLQVTSLARGNEPLRPSRAAVAGAGVAARERPETLWRDPALLSPSAARHAVTPASHPQGYLDCFDALVTDAHAAIRGEAPEGLQTFADDARVTDAVLASCDARGWVDV